MNRLYNLLLKSKYTLDRYYGDKAFTFRLDEGDLTKVFTVSKYGVKYIVEGYEGVSNFIKSFKVEFNTYKEVVDYLGI